MEEKKLILSKITNEIASGFEIMQSAGACIAILGSARLPQDNPYCKISEEIAQKVTQLGFGVITGGGPGIMEAANKGAKNTGGNSIGLYISLPSEQSPNPYTDSSLSLNFEYFFTRKFMFTQYAKAFIVMPGGIGTLDEFFEALALIQTKKTEGFPIILVGTEFWNGLLEWMKNSLLGTGLISEDDLSLFSIVNTADEAINQLKAFYDKSTTQKYF